MVDDIVEVKLTARAASGRLYRHDAILQYKEGRIYFLKSPFALKDEIKCMKGSRWHPKDADEEPRNCWSVEDCQRNRFQLAFLMEEDVYEWFDRDVIEQAYRAYTCDGEPKSPMTHQCILADHALTYHYQIWAAEMGVGKTLSAQMVIEHSGVTKWWWVGPKTSLPNMRREFKKWGFNFDGPIQITWLTYEGLTRLMDEWKPGDDLPQGVIFDESSRLKGATSQRTRAAQMLADLIREKHHMDGYVIEMSGTPSPKSPLDWWSQTEIAWPGFLKEGSPRALEQRLAFMVKQQYDSGIFNKRVGWKDDEKKCNKCGEYLDAGQHTNSAYFMDLMTEAKGEEVHEFVACENEVAKMYDRLDGLVVIKHKKDCLNLPDKRYRKIICKPNSSVLRVAQALKDAAPNTVTGMTWLRELSDGFQYKNVKAGKVTCPHCSPDNKGKVFEWFKSDDPEHSFRNVEAFDEEFKAGLERRLVDCPRCDGTGEADKKVRETKEVPCPKEKALKQLLEECEEVGRIVVFAGFTGSVDRVVRICQKEGWDVVRCDGRGFQVTDHDNKVLVSSSGDEALSYWSDMSNPRVAFVAHPESGGMSLTLTESRMAVYWSNSFKPEYRTQSEDRIHRKGMDENLGCQIVDLVHLPTDERVIQVIRENRKLELMTMGEMCDVLDDADTADDGEDALVEVAV